MENILDEVKQLRKQIKDIISVNNKEWYSLFKDEIRNSIAIEGIFTERKDLINVLDNNKKNKGQITASILGYFEAASTIYEYANNLYKQKEFFLRLSDIRQIHTLLMRYEQKEGYYKGQLGDFRKENVDVINTTFKPLDYIYLNDIMPLYVRWVNKNMQNSKINKIEFLAKSHLLFETIHPFRDGNGRVGRILLSYLLIGSGYMNIAIKGTKKIEREKYYNAMETGDNEFEKMLRMIEEGTKISLKLLYIFEKKTNFTLLKNILIEALIDSIDRIKENKIEIKDTDKIISLFEAARLFNYSQDYLRNLINRKRIPASRKGKLWFVKISDIQNYIKEIEKKYIIT